MAATIRIEDLLVEARRQLRAAPFRPSPREALLLMARVVGRREAQVLARSRETLTAAQAERFLGLLRRRLAGEPIAYLLGEREFYGRVFRVDRRVLIPRPETEHLVEAALELELPPRPRILDLGTGSGCLAVTLACELPAARVTAADLSPAALAVARQNARRHDAAARVALAASDLASALRTERFDLIVCNPPYVAGADAPALSREIREHEPATALFAPGEPLSMVRRLLAELTGLRSGAALLFEIGAGQAPAVERLVAASDFRLLETRRDYAGIPRVVATRRR